MATKHLDLSAILGGRKPSPLESSAQEPPRRGRPPRPYSENPSERWVRTNVILRESHSLALRDLAWYRRAMLKDCLDEALELYLNAHKDELEQVRLLAQQEQ